jgi:hypothetical protein
MEDGFDVSPEAADRLLVLHRAYLEAPPPDGAMGGDGPKERATAPAAAPEADAGSVASDEDRLGVESGR